jgi:nicotinamidase-related amidase
MFGAPLVEREDSVLVVVDVQDRFVAKLGEPAASSLVARICWLTRVAHHLGVPIVATAEDLRHVGPMHTDLAAVLPQGTTIFDKFVFGLAAEPQILEAIERTGRRICVLIGLETDVCIAHSVIGLIEQGYRAVVVTDATGSPEHEHGLARVSSAGALVMPARSLLYEWLRNVHETSALRTGLLDRYPPPPDVIL